MTFTQQVAEQVLPAAASIASAGILALMGLAGAWLTKHIKNAQVAAAISRVNGAADDAVRDISNTIVDGLKKNNAFDAVARAKVKLDAEAKIKAMLGSVTVDKLRDTLGFASDAEMIEFLSGKVESAVWKMQLQQTAATAAPPVAPAVAVPPVAILALLFGFMALGSSGCSFFQKHVDAITTDLSSCVGSNESQDKADLKKAAGQFLEQVLMCDVEGGISPANLGIDLPPCAAEALPGIEASLGPDGKAFVTCALNKIKHDPNALAAVKARAKTARVSVERRQ